MRYSTLAKMNFDKIFDLTAGVYFYFYNNRYRYRLRRRNVGLLYLLYVAGGLVRDTIYPSRSSGIRFPHEVEMAGEFMRGLPVLYLCATAVPAVERWYTFQVPEPRPFGEE